MDKIIRNVVFGIGIALIVVCGYVSIYAFFCGMADEDSESWVVCFGSAVVFGVGCFYFFICFPPRIAIALCKCKSYIADTLRLGGKQMLCDIIKWTIICIIAAIIFTIAYRVAISSGNRPVGAISGY
jgi:hypothetical protein